MINYAGTLIVVVDMEKSKQFYCDLFGLSVELDNKENVKLTGGIYLQEQKSWDSFTGFTADLTKNENRAELYFETDDIQEFIGKLNNFANIKYINKLKKEPWGQMTIRFYDPDGHIIEVGERTSK
jgi:catechol 2,3-dioxygenase-like lactoylglutathione lyase family enzyme